MKPPTALTWRQRRMLERLTELHREAHKPVHYTAIARELGIHNTTAYEMLKLLEQEGYVTSDYVLSGNTGPGRSTVVFAPAEQANAALASSSRLGQDPKWEMAKNEILSRLGQSRDVEQAFLDELVSRLSNVEEPLVYCAEVLTALILNISCEARVRLQEQGVFLQQLVTGPQARNLLQLLPGLALGLALPGQVQRVSERLIECSEQCQTCLQQLDDAKQRTLAEFVRQVVAALPEITSTEGQEHPVT
jgi:hypothetical protein